MAVDLKKELEDIKNNPITFILVSAEKYAQTNLDILKILVNEKKMSGIYITVNKPYKRVIEIFNKNKINTDRVFFIDTITTTKEESERTENCLFIGSPESLTDLSIALGEAVRSIPGEKFIFLDTLSTLLIYNGAGTVTRFAHFLTSKMRDWGVIGIIISLEKETNPELRAQLTQFCDKIVDLEKK